MKGNWFLVYLLILPCLLLAKDNVAVLDFSIGSNVSASDQQMIANRLEMEMIATKAFNVLERRQMNTILSEQGFQQTGACSASDCQVQMGQLLGVDNILTGSIGKVGQIFSMSVKLVDVQSGSIKASHSIDVAGDLSEVLTTGCATLAQKLASGSESSSTQQGSSKRVWWIAGGITVLAAMGIGTYVLLSPEEDKTIQRDKTIGTSK